MGAITYFEERLRGSDWGEPTDRETAGFDVRVLEFGGFVHIEMKPAAQDDRVRYIALFSPNEAKSFLDGFAAAMRRVGVLGDR
ncbi:MAG: hypothetical protein IPM18_12955 [Phycisphaerales bacterium]|nr:hypothetical protein [Phycisphaerales bacterium]